MNKATLARTGESGESPASFRLPDTATTGAGDWAHPRPVLKTPSGEYTFWPLARHTILCSRVLCVQRGTHEVRVMGEPVSWWCLDHGIAEMLRLSADEWRMVADAVAA